MLTLVAFELNGNKKHRPIARAVFKVRVLERLDVRSLRTLAVLSGLDVKADALALLEVAVTLALDRAEMHEHVGVALVRDEAEALFTVEPLHNTFWHVYS